jgi:hypothetical protein
MISLKSSAVFGLRLKSLRKEFSIYGFSFESASTGGRTVVIVVIGVAAFRCATAKCLAASGAGKEAL